MSYKQFPVLRLFFNEPAAKTAQQILHERQFKRLVKWVDDIPDFMRKNLEDNVSKSVQGGVQPDSLREGLSASKNVFQCMAEYRGGKAHQKASSVINIDGAAFSREEMARLRDGFAAVHDLALAYNVDIGFAGFDNLPRNHTVTRNSMASADNVIFYFDTDATYNYFSHPDFSAKAGELKELEARLNGRFITSKPQAPESQNIGSDAPRI